MGEHGTVRFKGKASAGETLLQLVEQRLLQVQLLNLLRLEKTYRLHVHLQKLCHREPGLLFLLFCIRLTQTYCHVSRRILFFLLSLVPLLPSSLVEP